MMKTLFFIMLLLIVKVFEGQVVTSCEMPDSLYYDVDWRFNRDIAIDNSGNVWLAIDGGVVKLDRDFSVLNFYTEYNSNLPHFYCQAIGIDTSNHIWIGSAGGVLAEYDGGETWISYSPYYDVTNIKVSDCNEVWFHSWNSGIAYYDRANFHWYNTTNSDIASDNTYDLEIQDDTIVWVATMDCGVSKFCNGEFMSFNLENSEITSNVVYGIEIDTNKTVYFGTDSGLAYFDGNTWGALKSLNDSIPIMSCDPLLVDSENYLWFTAITNSADSILVRYRNEVSYILNSTQLGVPLSYRYNSMIELDSGKYALISKTVNETDIVAISLVDNAEVSVVTPKLDVFPNPATKSICISGISKLLSIRIYNLKGELTYISSMVDSYHVDVDISHLGSGFFLLQIEQESGAIYQKKLIVN